MEFVDYNGNDINILTEDRVSDNIVLNSSFQVWDLPNKTITGTNEIYCMCANGWMVAGTATNVSNGISFKSLSNQYNSLTQYLRIDKDLLIDKTLSFSISINNVIYSITGQLQQYSDQLTNSEYAIYKIISGSIQSTTKSGIIGYYDSSDRFIIRYFNDYTAATNVINWIKLEISDKPTKYNTDPLKDMISHNFVINIQSWDNYFSARGDDNRYCVQIPYNNILGVKSIQSFNNYNLELSSYKPGNEFASISSANYSNAQMYNNYIELNYTRPSNAAILYSGNVVFTTDTYFCVY